MKVIVLTKQVEDYDSAPSTSVEGVFTRPEKALEEGKKFFKKIQDNNEIGCDEEYAADLDIKEFPDSIDMTKNSYAEAYIYNTFNDNCITLGLQVMDVEE